jgi:hypothetical protein
MSTTAPKSFVGPSVPPTPKMAPPAPVTVPHAPAAPVVEDHNKIPIQGAASIRPLTTEPVDPRANMKLSDKLLTVNSADPGFCDLRNILASYFASKGE